VTLLHPTQTQKRLVRRWMIAEEHDMGFSLRLEFERAKHSTAVHAHADCVADFVGRGIGLLYHNASMP
jgi:hypothetical protein